MSGKFHFYGSLKFDEREACFFRQSNFAENDDTNVRVSIRASTLLE